MKKTFAFMILTYLLLTINSGAVDQNFGKWLVLGKYIWPNNFVGNRHSEEIDYLKQWIIERLSWIDQQIITI